MKNQQPTMAELMVGTPRSSSRNTDQGIEKAAAQAQVGEIFEGLTKEAKDDLIGTMGWAGKVFGEQVAAALEPTLSKMAGLVAEIKVASSKTRQKNRELVEEYEAGSPAGPNPGDLPAKLKNKHTMKNDANVAATATPTSQESPGARGWGAATQKRQALATAKTIEEVKTGADASAVLANLRGEAGQQDEGTKEASLAEIGKKFGDMLRQDLQNQ